MTGSKTSKSENTLLNWSIILAPIAIMVLIFALSSRSHLPDLAGGRDIQNIAGHFTVYAALGASLTVLFRALGWSTGKTLIVTVLLATLYGVSDEFHQSFVPNRSVDSKDVFVDFLGAFFGSVGALLLLRHRGMNASASLDAAPDQPVDESS